VVVVVGVVEAVVWWLPQPANRTTASSAASAGSAGFT
jgi:hypothetical protein